ncbi:MAG: tRNA (adenosine(37)-N6)-threonylcarbamoyltransferase complex ATPase subunit type 1 TsaE [Rhizobiaceae bacterium]
MKSRTTTLDLKDEAATSRLGQDIAAAVKPGDLIALEGDLGAGKTTLARALIRAATAKPGLEVPSPTYTLVQYYDGVLPVAHFDLYRLTDGSELYELGLEEALEQGIVVVEWPQNAADTLPSPALTVNLSETADGGRSAIVQAAPETEARLRRSMQLRSFLETSGWGEASRALFVGDASTRRYETVSMPGAPPQLVMDAPEQPDGPPIREGLPYSRIAHLSESVVPFVAVDHALRENGFSAPQISAADLANGFLLIEDFGREGVVNDRLEPIPDRYMSAIELLAQAHQRKWQTAIDGPFGARHQLPPYDREAMMIEVELLLDWYMPAITGRQPDEGERHEFGQAWGSVISELAGVETGLVMRDFHSPNLIWRSGHQGTDRLGLIDFQDALIGPLAYDVASLAQDARVTVAAELEIDLLSEYCRLRKESGSFNEMDFQKSYAIMAVQRCSKILGIFVRLDKRDGKPVYLKHLPRMREYLMRSIGHEALAPVFALYHRWGLLDEASA